MIAAIADDVTGAAEIAGIGWRFGLRAQVSTTFDPGADADLVVIDTNTRSDTGDVARQTVETLARRLHSSRIPCCYKKVDSVLRGNVRAELEAIIRVLGKTRVLLAPANPSKGRVIVDGRYLINHIPLDETEFGNDPEHPARSCLVMELLNAPERCPVCILKSAACTSSKQGVIVAEAQTPADLSQWAECLDKRTLAAGGADFFKAILEKRLAIRSGDALVSLGGTKWFVCGSGSEVSRRAVAEAAHVGIPVCPMPEALFRNPSCDESLIGQWARDIVAALAAHGFAVAAIAQPMTADARAALDLRTHLAALVQQVLSRTKVRELFIEGGATVRAILDRMGWDTLNVLGEYEPGVVRLSTRGEQEQIVTLKPGSYAWPDTLWRQFAQATRRDS